MPDRLGREGDPEAEAVMGELGHAVREPFNTTVVCGVIVRVVEPQSLVSWQFPIPFGVSISFGHSSDSMTLKLNCAHWHYLIHTASGPSTGTCTTLAACL